MAKSTKKDTPQGKDAKPAEERKPWQLSRRNKVLIGVICFLFAVAMLLSFISYFIYGSYDQSELTAFGNREQDVQNWLGKVGASLAHFFLYSGFGIASFIFIRFFFLAGAYLVLDLPVKKLKKTLNQKIFG